MINTKGNKLKKFLKKIQKNSKKLFLKKERNFEKEAKDLFVLLEIYTIAIIPLLLFEGSWWGSLFFLSISVLGFLFKRKLIVFFGKRMESSSKKRVPMLVAFKRSFYLLVFFIIPLFFAFLFMNGQWGIEGGLQFSSHLANGGIIYGDGDSAVKIIPRGDGYLSDAKYFLGEVLEIPILSVCFSNTLNNFSEDDFIFFESKIFIEEEPSEVRFNEKVCKDTTINKKVIPYRWESHYQTVYREMLSPEKLSYNVDVKLNYRIIYVIILTILAWVAILHLIYHVIKDFNSIGIKSKS